jgi:SAM-dependent methyltransferase
MTSQPTQSDPIFARVYAFMSRFGRETVGRYRQELLDGVSGRVLEIGAGNGDNFAHYPAGVSEVVAVEPEPHLRKLAFAAAARAPVVISVQDGVGERLPFADGSFDVVVSSLVLCSVADPAQTLAELHRVTRPNGELRFFEHVRSSASVSAMLQLALDRSLMWPFMAGGCHCARQTVMEVERCFTIERARELSLARPWAPVNPFVIGVARRTGSTAEPKVDER